MESKNVKLKRSFPRMDRVDLSASQAETDVQLREAHTTQAANETLGGSPYESIQSKVNRLKKDPEADLSQLDKFDRCLRKKNAHNHETGPKNKQMRQPNEDKGRRNGGDRFQ